VPQTTLKARQATYIVPWASTLRCEARVDLVVGTWTSKYRFGRCLKSWSLQNWVLFLLWSPQLSPSASSDLRWHDSFLVDCAFYSFIAQLHATPPLSRNMNLVVLRRIFFPMANQQAHWLTKHMLTQTGCHSLQQPSKLAIVPVEQCSKPANVIAWYSLVEGAFPYWAIIILNPFFCIYWAIFHSRIPTNLLGHITPNPFYWAISFPIYWGIPPTISKIINQPPFINYVPVQGGAP
jgi:hypothetical protein